MTEVRVIVDGAVLPVRVPSMGPQGIPGVPGINPWVAVTATRTAADGDRLQCSTAGGAFTVTLPADPAEGAEVWIYKSGAADLTLARNGETFNGASEDLIVDVVDVTLVLTFRTGTWRY